MNINYPRDTPKQKKTSIALTTLTCSLVALLGYEVFTQNTPISASDRGTLEKLPIILDDDADDDEYSTGELTYSIGKTEQTHQRKETIQSLKALTNDLIRQLTDLRTQILTRKLEENQTKELKQELAEAQRSYKDLEEKKELLSEEFLAAKKQMQELADAQENYNDLLEKKELLRNELLEARERIKDLEADGPSALQLQKELNNVHAKYDQLLNKKKLLKEELIRSRDEIADHQNTHQNLIQKKKELKDYYVQQNHKHKESKIANQELVAEIEVMRELLKENQSRRMIAEDSNAKLVGRIRQLKDEQYQYLTENEELEKALVESSAIIDILKQSLAHTERRLRFFANNQMQYIQGKSDPLTLSFLPKNFSLHSHAVNFPQTDDASYEESPKHYDMWNQLAMLGSYGIPRSASKDFFSKEHTHAATQELKEKVQQLQDDLVASNSDNIILQSTLNSLSDEMQMLQIQLFLAEQHLQEFERKAQEPAPATHSKPTYDALSHYFNISGKLPYSSRQKSSDDTALNEIQQELELSQLCSGCLENRVNQLNNQIISLQRQLLSYEDKIQAQTDHINRAGSNTSASEALSNLNSELYASTASNNVLTRNIETLNQQLDDFNQKIESYQNILDAMQANETADQQHQDLLLTSLNANLSQQAPPYAQGTSHFINALHHLSKLQHAKTPEELADEVVESLQNRILQLKTELALAKELDTPLNIDELPDDDSADSETYPEEPQEAVENRQEESEALKNEIVSLQEALRQEILKNQPAPGIRIAHTGSLIASKSKPQTTQLNAVCSQVAQVGSKSLLLCNLSSEELIKDALLHRSRTDTLEKEIEEITTEADQQFQRILHLEKQLKSLSEENKILLDKSKDVALVEDSEIEKLRTKELMFQEQLESLQEESKNHKQKISQLENQLEAKNLESADDDETEKLRAKTLQLEQQLETLLEQSKNQQQKATLLENQLEALNQTHENSKQLHDSDKIETEQHRAHIKKLELELQTLLKESKSQQQKIVHLEKKLSSSQQEKKTVQDQQSKVMADREIEVSKPISDSSDDEYDSLDDDE